MSDLALTGGPAAAADLRARAGRWPRVHDAAAAHAALQGVLDSGHWGRLHEESYASRFEAAFAAYQQARHGLAVANGTVSLQLILRTLNIGFGDEVIVPEALAQSPLRGVPGVPRYDQLNLPVTERVCAREQITIPHPILLTGEAGVDMITASVAKILDNCDALRRWWQAQSEASQLAASASA